MQAKLQLLLVIALLNLAACASSPKSEADQYNNLRKSTIYKAYQKVSIEAMKPVVNEYDKQLAKKDRPQVASEQVHALVGLIWIASMQPDFALAETDYAMDSVRDPRDRYAILILQSVAMHQQGWHFLAKQTSLEAKALGQINNLGNNYNNILLLTHIAGSILALQEGNITYVASEIREYGILSNQAWMVDLGDATQQMYTGAHAQAIAKLENMQDNADLSAIERDGVGRVIEAAKAGGKDAPYEVAKAAVYLTADVAIKASPLTPKIIEQLPEKYQKKLAKYQ